MSGRHILVVVAHPDDAELTCAGSIARWVGEGDRATLLIATDGARGGKHQGTDPEAITAVRRVEQQEAAGVIGFESVLFLGFPDGELSDDEVLRGMLVRQIRTLRPDVVVAADPLTVIHQNTYINHRDHRMLGTALLDAMYPQASNAGYFPEQFAEGLRLYKVPEVLLATTESPNYWVDVTQTIEIRFDALRRHRSQMQLWPDGGEFIIQSQRKAAAVLGLRRGFRYGEEFRRILANPLT